MSGLSTQTIRRMVLTGGIVAITVTGALYGAGLKSRQEFKQGRKVALEATPLEKIEQLEMTKARLLRYREEFQSKIDRFSTGSESTNTNP